MLEAKDYIWKRLRRSLRSWRDEGEFQAAQAELAVLRTQAFVPARAVDLWYFDEAGFTLQPCIPYAWQKIGTTLELASTHGPRQNILGFLNFTTMTQALFEVLKGVGSKYRITFA